MMKYEVGELIWKKGDAEMPPEAKHVVDIAKGEVLLKSLNLSDDLANEIRYNADKCSQSISDYISEILAERLVATS